jgi:hypothetical protein
MPPEWWPCLRMSSQQANWSTNCCSVLTSHSKMIGPWWIYWDLLGLLSGFRVTTGYYPQDPWGPHLVMFTLRTSASRFMRWISSCRHDFQQHQRTKWPFSIVNC